LNCSYIVRRLLIHVVSDSHTYELTNFDSFLFI